MLRNRPDVVQDWSDEEVARRWWFLFRARKAAAGQPEEPTAADLQMLTEQKAAVAAGPGRRASDKGFLPVNLSEYLRLLDWTGRQTRPDRWGAIPGELAPILSRLQLKSVRLTPCLAPRPC